MSHALQGAPRASCVSLRAYPVHPRHLARLLVTGLAIAAVLVPVVVSGPVTAHGATPAIRSTRLLPARVQPGRTVTRQGIAARAPARGGFAFGILEGTDGRTRSIYLRTTAGGRVRAGALAGAGGAATARVSSDSAVALQTASAGVASAAPDCRDTSRVLFPWRVVMLKWTVDPRGTPMTLRDPVGGNTLLVKTLRRAQHDITWGRNACGRPDRVQALGWFTRRTDRVAGVSAAGGCTGADGQGTVSFGPLPYPSVAMTCVYGVKRGVATEADIRINPNAGWALRLAGCSGTELLLEAVIAHEFGHIYGLGHTPASPWLTMSPIIRYCDASNITLGMGDLLGLESKNR